MGFVEDIIIYLLIYSALQCDDGGVCGAVGRASVSNSNASVSYASETDSCGFESATGRKLYGLMLAGMRHLKEAGNPTRSDGSLNRGLVCGARIPPCTDLKDPDSDAEAQVSTGYKNTPSTH